jgi:DNA replication and repair protein RecF
MVRSGCDYYRLEGRSVQTQSTREIAVAYERGGRKRVTVDGVGIKLAELYCDFCAVAAGPEDSNILSGSPSTRRRFIDIYLSQYSNQYLSNLTDYYKVLAQKNAALKRNIDPAPFNELLVDCGVRIMRDRCDFLQRVGQLAFNFYSDISGDGGFSLTYQPSVAISDDDYGADALREAFNAALRKHAERERIMETAMVGIQRDDIAIAINSLPARTHGSQGEWRTGAIALKLAVYDILKGKRDSEPVLLLDEIFAELDANRSRALMDAFGDVEQLFLTTALDVPDFLKDACAAYRIADGQIVKGN